MTFTDISPIAWPTSWLVIFCLSFIGVTIPAYLWLFTKDEERQVSQNEGTQSLRRCVSLLKIYPENDDSETDIDIIAIHGLDTKSPETWTWKDPHDRENTDKWTNWLQDVRMLPSQLQRVRIFTCDWPAELFQPTDLVQKTGEELALLLCDGIQRRPPIADGHGNKDRPILFIASCLGGILLMKALVEINDKRNNYHSLRLATRGIVFLATPFRGTSFQDVATWAEPALGAWALFRGQETSKLLAVVKESTSDLARLVGKFTQICIDADNPYQVFSFYELGKTSLSRKVFPWVPPYFERRKQLVDEPSARLDIVQNPEPLDRSHVLMNKFSGPECPDYRHVSGKIHEMLEKIRKGSLLKQADDYIQNEYKRNDRLRIERLSGETLPMKQCYINLAILKQPDKDIKGLRRKETEAGSQSSPFSLSARLKVDQSDQSVQVDLPKLFNQHEGHDRTMKQPHRILIQGRAGVGKTTLCKKIIHDFIDHDVWADLFDRVLWVPLRNLKLEERRRSVGYNLGNLLYDEFFSQDLRGKDLANVLWQTLKDANDRTLFVLDGLDEVLQELSSNDSMSCFLKTLLAQPNVIITSRPYGQASIILSNPDLELETIGFYQAQVDEYLHKTFVDSRTVSEVQFFLQNHRLLQDLVRIPVQLDALCFCWNDGIFSNSKLDTMTAVYQAIELGLWKKDILQLEKQHNGRPVTKSQIHESNLPGIRGLIKNEIDFLQRLAFAGMYNNVIDFEPKHRSQIENNLISPTTDFLLDKTLPRLSFLRTSDLSSRNRSRSYHFLHLTFEEFFAAQYFVRQWKTGKPLQHVVLDGQENEGPPGTAIEFLQKHKYTARYDIMWRFVAGLLDGEDKAEEFFAEIEKQPRDLLGPAHQRLIMHCLSEVASPTMLSRRRELENNISQWILFECQLRGSSSLAGESECPDGALITALQDNLKRRDILQSISLFYEYLSQAKITALVSLLRDHDKSIRWEAALALGAQTNLPETVVTALVSLLRDDDRDVRWAVAGALGRQKNLPETVMTTLVLLLRDGDRYTRLTAAHTLSCQMNLLEMAMTALVSLLRDDDKDTRSTAARALGNQTNLTKTTMTALVSLLRDGDDEVTRSAAALSLGCQTNLPDTEMTALVSLLRNDDRGSRLAAADALGHQTNLPARAMMALVSVLHDDDDKGTRLAAVRALGRQIKLPEVAMMALVSLLCDGDKGTRSTAAHALGRQMNLPATAITGLISLLRDDDNGTRLTAVLALDRQTSLPETAIIGLISLLRDDDNDTRSMAAHALGRQMNLPATAITSLISLLRDDDNGTRLAAVLALDCQTSLPETAMTVLVSLLRDHDRSIRCDAAHALGCQTNLPETATMALVSLLHNGDQFSQVLAAFFLDRQTILSETTVTALISLLCDNNKDTQSAVAFALGGQTNLLQHILRHIGFASNNKPIVQGANTPLRNPRFVNVLYESLLYHSFLKQFSLCIDSNDVSCIINQNSGIQAVSLKGQDLLSRFENGINQGQQLCNVYKYRLWDTATNVI